jgi:hypothetical protein
MAATASIAKSAASIINFFISSVPPSRLYPASPTEPCPDDRNII